MAGRIRSVKPEILDDEKTANLSHLEWRLFVSLWLIADDYGNLRGDPGYVRSQTLWAQDESRDSVSKALETLAGVSLLSPYTVRGQSYYHVNGWDKHQKVDKPGKPRMPGPSEADPPASDDSRDYLEEPEEIPETLAPDLRPPTKTTITDRREAEASAMSEVAIGEINRIAGSHYDPKADTSLKLCRALVKAKRTNDDVMLVIRSKAAWAADPKMSEFFRPKTLLGPENFATYLDDAKGRGSPRDGPRWPGNSSPNLPLKPSSIL